MKNINFNLVAGQEVKRNFTSCICFLLLVFSSELAFSQVEIERGDPKNNSNIPKFFKSRLVEIDEELDMVEKGKIKAIAISPGGRVVYSVTYGEKDSLPSIANYNSAVAARSLDNFSKKGSTTKPIIFFLGPVHGQEVEGIVGLINLIHIAETGRDHRGQEWASLKNKFDQCRVIIVPCGNPDGRMRNPYNSFVGLPTRVMTKYGQGTRKDGSLYGWPKAKSVHPMQGDVAILGAYFNDDGINMMHDDFFSPMATETEAILKIARTEVPDITVSLHSHANFPRILQTNYVPWFMKKRIFDLSRKLNNRFEQEGLAFTPKEWITEPSVEDKDFPPRSSFNLNSALHHQSGTMAFTFECSLGTIDEVNEKPMVTHADILDIQLKMYEEIFDTVLQNKSK